MMKAEEWAAVKGRWERGEAEMPCWWRRRVAAVFLTVETTFWCSSIYGKNQCCFWCSDISDSQLPICFCSTCRTYNKIFFSPNNCPNMIVQSPNVLLEKNLTWSSLMRDTPLLYNRQDSVARSSTEAEYRAMSDATAEISWICNILRELGIPQYKPPELYGDNLSAVYLTANPAFHKRSKHFANHYHYVHEKVALGTIMVKHIHGQDQIANIFTKSLPPERFNSLRYKLGVVFPPTQSLRGTISSTSVALISLVKNNIVSQEQVKKEVEKVVSTEDKTNLMGSTSSRPINKVKLKKFNTPNKPNKETESSSSLQRLSSQRLSTHVQRDEKTINKGKANVDCMEPIKLSNKFECLDHCETK